MQGVSRGMPGRSRVVAEPPHVISTDETRSSPAAGRQWRRCCADSDRHRTCPNLFRGAARNWTRGLGKAVGTGNRRADDFRRQEYPRSEEHTSELQSQSNLVCRLLLEKKKIKL